MDSKIKDLISQEQFSLSQKEKEGLILPILNYQIKNNMDFSVNLNKFYISLGDGAPNFRNIIDICPLPVSMFKLFDLKTCNDENIIRTLMSSGTTSQIRSKIYIDKITSFRQSRALISILKNYIGKNRRPVLVIDTENVVKKGDSLTARGAAIRGISQFGRKITYLMDEINGELYINYDRLKKFSEEFKGQEILVSGFTYIVWSRFVQEINKNEFKLDFPDMKLVHSGGWKKLKTQAVTKELFSKEVAKIFGTDPSNIIDFYGMVEQLGVVFLDCSEGHKHIPDFADVIIRDIYSMNENPIGIPGLIEIVSIIPNSYPGQAIITEDVGVLIGIDDCPCGRKGKYFRFKSRVEKTETRGCGDTFAEKRRTKND